MTYKLHHSPKEKKTVKVKKSFYCVYNSHCNKDSLGGRGSATLISSPSPWMSLLYRNVQWCAPSSLGLLLGFIIYHLELTRNFFFQCNFSGVQDRNEITGFVLPSCNNASARQRQHFHLPGVFKQQIWYHSSGSRTPCLYGIKKKKKRPSGGLFWPSFFPKLLLSALWIVMLFKQFFK